MRKLSSKEMALIICFAALHAATSYIPLFSVVGAESESISISKGDSAKLTFVGCTNPVYFDAFSQLAAQPTIMVVPALKALRKHGFRV